MIYLISRNHSNLRYCVIDSSIGPFFFARKEQILLQQDSYRKIQKQSKITTRSSWIPSLTKTNKPLRRRAAATSPHMPWIRRSPSTVGKSSVLGSWEPPPCCLDADVLQNSNSTFRDITHLDPPSRGLRRGNAMQRCSAEPRAPGRQRSSSRDPQTTAARGEDLRPKTPLRPRRPLPNAAG
jgi:hypothetical protein